MSLTRRLAPAAALVALAGMASAPPAQAQNLPALSFTLDPADPIDIAPGTAGVFYGEITNDTGVDLLASDLSFSFGGYDPSLVTTVTQDLGSPDFLIPAATTSPSVDLFTLGLDPAAPLGSTYEVDATLSDVNGNAAGPAPVLFTAAAPPVPPPAVPEPSAIWLLAFGLPLVVTPRHRAPRA